jgi:hypothetical protein
MTQPGHMCLFVLPCLVLRRWRNCHGFGVFAEEAVRRPDETADCGALFAPRIGVRPAAWSPLPRALCTLSVDRNAYAMSCTASGKKTACSFPFRPPKTD